MSISFPLRTLYYFCFKSLAKKCCTYHNSWGAIVACGKICSHHFGWVEKSNCQIQIMTQKLLMKWTHDKSQVIFNYSCRKSKISWINLHLQQKYTISQSPCTAFMAGNLENDSIAFSHIRPLWISAYLKYTGSVSVLQSICSLADLTVSGMLKTASNWMLCLTSHWQSYKHMVRNV